MNTVIKAEYLSAEFVITHNSLEVLKVELMLGNEPIDLTETLKEKFQIIFF